MEFNYILQPINMLIHQEYSITCISVKIRKGNHQNILHLRTLYFYFPKNVILFCTSKKGYKIDFTVSYYNGLSTR